MLLIVKVMEWSGNFLPLVFFLSVALGKLVILYLYPMLIQPLFSTQEELPEYAAPLRIYILKEAKKVGIKDNKILLEKSFQYDVHVNASTFLG